MGFLKRLLGFGTTVAGTVAAVKVTEKVKENNPDGVQDVNGDGKVASTVTVPSMAGRFLKLKYIVRQPAACAPAMSVSGSSPIISTWSAVAPLTCCA